MCYTVLMANVLIAKKFYIIHEQRFDILKITPHSSNFQRVLSLGLSSFQILWAMIIAVLSNLWPISSYSDGSTSTSVVGVPVLIFINSYILQKSLQS
jgi:hypothetical protein